MPNASDANPTVYARHLAVGAVIVLPLLADNGDYEPATPEDVFVVKTVAVRSDGSVSTLLADINGKMNRIIFGKGEIIRLKV